MFELKGKYEKARVFADIIEEEAIAQIINMLNMPFVEGSSVAIMPDVHAGAGCTIGTTLTIKDCIVPNLVGVDIGCGVTMSKIKGMDTSDKGFKHLDEVIREFIPSGYDTRDKDFTSQGKEFKSGRFLYEKANGISLEDLECAPFVNIDRAYNSLGTLGGGNHYIEVNKSSEGVYLSVHSGSRSLGLGTAKHYQKIAVQERKSDIELSKGIIEEIKAMYKDDKKKIGIMIAQNRKEQNTPDALCWLDRNTGNGFDSYMHDMAIIQKYADINRHSIISEICSKMGWAIENEVNTIHNYIDVKNMILRKGAVSANLGERLVIPMNMRDGVLICTGKGNPEWNYSAPHGAGRLMSRSKAKENVNMNSFKESMQGIYTTSVSRDTLDESPMAYKPMESIMSIIGDTVSINSIAAPLYNFKAGEQERKVSVKKESPEEPETTMFSIER